MNPGTAGPRTAIRLHPAASATRSRAARPLAILLVAAAPGCASRGVLPLEAEVSPVEVLRTGDYSEGVVLDREGNLYFSHSSQITVLRPDGTSGKWAETGAPNGHKVLADGTHLVCDGSRHAVLRLEPTGTVIAEASRECEGKPLRAPNDLSLDPAGGFYFTDPGDSTREKPDGRIHYVDAAGTTHLVAEGFAYPNGIVLAPDARRLFVAESARNRILVFVLSAPGHAGPFEVFAELPSKGAGQVENMPDGMCLDEAGNLYVAHYGMGQVQVLDPAGNLLRSYSGGNLQTSNVAFGGAGHDRLFVTGGQPGALFRLDLGVRGREIRP